MISKGSGECDRDEAEAKIGSETREIAERERDLVALANTNEGHC